MKKTPKAAAAGPKKKAKKKTSPRSVRKPGVLKKVAKALRRPRKKKAAVGLSSLQKVLVAHGVEKKAPAVRPPFPAYRGTMPYIFVSYSHADMKEVFRIIKQLNASRYRIWFDEGIEPGNEWPEVVGRAVLACSQFIVFMSPTAVDSRNVRNEINLATSADKNIIVIYLKSTPLSEGLLLQVGTVQYFNKFEMADKEFVDKLKRVLSNDLHN
ncbi:MAG: toll/interleukin-1 receptor domain-containing protein [Spirochaetaceae bacterium]|nr:MAG: toll/interleukin-1 receptor domain-containing protein [Spirochaetaceae bacterium]